MQKKFKSQSDFEFVTALPNTSQKPDFIYLNKSQEELKELFNKILNENTIKQKTISCLKNSIETAKQETLISIQSEELAQKIAGLIQKLEKKAEDLTKAKSEQSILTHKKNRLKEETEGFRGSVIELQKNFEIATFNYSSLNKLKLSSKFAMISSNLALEKCEKHFDQYSSDFKLNSEALKRKLKTASDRNNEKMKQTSSLDLALDRRKNVRKQFCKDYESCLKDLSKLTKNKEANQELLKSFKKGFSVIRDFINKDQPIRNDLPDCDGNLIEKIIGKMKEFEFRSESLDLNCQKLSEQEAKFRAELVFLKKELRVLKDAESGQKSFIEIREGSLENNALKNELLVIKIYFLLAEGLYENLEKLSSVHCSEKETKEKLSCLLHNLKQFRIGAQKRNRSDIRRFSIEKIAGKNKNFEQKIEVFNSISLSPNEIKNTFLEVFQDDTKNSKFFLRIIKDSPVLKIFIDRESLELFCRRNKGQAPEFFFKDFSTFGNSILTDRLEKMLLEINDFFLDLNKKFSLKTKPNQNTENRYFILNPSSFKFRSQSSFHYKISEKHSIKPEPAPINPKTSNKEPAKVLSRSIPRLYSLSKTAVTQQKIMKEFLENQKKEAHLQSTSKLISKASLKFLELPYIKKFLLKSSSTSRNFL